MSSLLQAWTYPLVDALLTAMTWALFLRLVFFTASVTLGDGLLSRILRRLTAPAIEAAHVITPAGLPVAFVIIAAIFWLILLRLIVFMIMSHYGLLPPAGATP